MGRFGKGGRSMKLLAWTEYENAAREVATELQKNGRPILVQQEPGSHETDRHLKEVWTIRENGKGDGNESGH